MRPSLSIVIVNWNSGESLSACLASIERATKARFELDSVVIVDNASTDGSLSAAEASSLPIEILRNTRNTGFAAACNQGAARRRSDLLLFLNPDTELDAAALDDSVAFLQRPDHATVGVVGIQLRGRDGDVSRTCARFPTFGRLLAMSVGLSSIAPALFPGVEMGTWDHRDTRQVDHVIGAYYLVRRRAFEEVGGFDARFFVYFEDLDLSLRLARAGWQVWYLATAAAYHEAGGASKRVKARRLLYVCRSRVQLAWKHLPAWQAAAITGAVLLLEPVARVARAGIARDVRGVWDAIVGSALNWRAFLAGPRVFVLGERRDSIHA